MRLADGPATRERRSDGVRSDELDAIANYLAANWLEIAGFVTTMVGIWLTTRRMLICWPVVLIADLLYLVVFYRGSLFSDALLQIFFVAFTLYGWWHWWRGVREEGEVRVVPLSACELADGHWLRARWAGLALGFMDDADSRHGASSSGCSADEL